MSITAPAPAPTTDAPVTVRRAEPHEYEEVRSLLLEAFASRFWITSGYRANLRDIEGHLAQGEELYLAVQARATSSSQRRGEEILGAVFIPRTLQTGPDGLPEQSFGRLAVSPEAGGRGVARALLGHVEQIAQARGAARIAIHSGPQMHGAHRMYEHLGYTRRPEREDRVVDSGQRLLVYTRQLGQEPAAWQAARTAEALADAAALAGAADQEPSRQETGRDDRLARLNQYLGSSRYLEGRQPTAADTRFLAALLRDYGADPGPLTRYPQLWAYARDLLACPGQVTARQLAEAGVLASTDGPQPARLQPEHNPLALWSEPAYREYLSTGLGAA
ncbi:MAG: GNAT family N-acetyltransferase [Actinomyces urogenitalis]|uniref:GNAT family N-acetyltransferase n=1 Tax=Actinomyces urogenitalis TaxID=103621 RepID=UPI002A822213|nr:GNAT family N-acetyltransferase [Actinomyces urogenitalis]MDY3679660.1 GNAT family N-acetyltransferase [Actinomyces urogenitalis]